MHETFTKRTSTTTQLTSEIIPKLFEHLNFTGMKMLDSRDFLL